MQGLEEETVLLKGKGSLRQVQIIRYQNLWVQSNCLEWSKGF